MAISACLPKRTATNDAYNGPSYEKILAMRKAFVTPSAVPFYRKPLLIHRGDMQYLYDHKGAKYLGMLSSSCRRYLSTRLHRFYLDMFGGIVTVSVGHCHP